MIEYILDCAIRLMNLRVVSSSIAFTALPPLSMWGPYSITAGPTQRFNELRSPAAFAIDKNETGGKVVLFMIRMYHQTTRVIGGGGHPVGERPSASSFRPCGSSTGCTGKRLTITHRQSDHAGRADCGREALRDDLLSDRRIAQAIAVSSYIVLPGLRIMHLAAWRPILITRVDTYSNTPCKRSKRCAMSTARPSVVVKYGDWLQERLHR